MKTKSDSTFSLYAVVRRNAGLMLGLTFGLTCNSAFPEFSLSEDSHLDWIQESGFSITSRDAGVTSITHENPDFSGSVLQVSGGDEVSLQSGIQVTYDWGTFLLEWEIEAGIAYGTFTLTNLSDEVIADFSINLLTLVVSDQSLQVDGFDDVNLTTLDNMAFHSWTIRNTRLTAGLTSLDPPLRMLVESSPAGDNASAWILTLTGGVHRMDDDGISLPILGTARIEPNESLTGKFMLKESSTDISPELAEAVFWSKFYQENQPLVDWPDRRPIGMLFLTSKHSASNPKGLFWDESLDASDPDAVLASAISYAERSVEALLEIDAQAAIAWDIEGTDLPISFVGDPRMLPIINPAMDAVADAFFKVFTDAGLKVGVTLRPTQVYFDENQSKWRHGTGSHGPDRNPLNENYDEVWPEGLPWWRFYPLVERLDRRIQYAMDRWGCKLFYIDTNGIFRERYAPGDFRWTLLNAGILRELMLRHPDILIFPELTLGWEQDHHLAYWGTCAPYGELDLGSTGTAPSVRQAFPKAFSSINISDGNIEANRQALVDSVRNGDILFCRGWFKDSRNQILKEIYEEASTSSP